MNKNIICCIGDSHTKERWGGHWSNDLKNRVKKKTEKKTLLYRFCGDGYMTLNSMNLSDKALSKDPNIVVLFIGTNDVLDLIWKEEDNVKMFEGHRKQIKLDAIVPNYENSFDNFKKLYFELVEKIAVAPSVMRLLCVGLSPLGEKLDSKTNQLVQQYCKAIKTIAHNQNVKTDNVTFIDFNQVLTSEIESYQSEHNIKDPVDFNGATDQMDIAKPMLGNKLKNNCCCISYNKLSNAENRIVLTNDDIHLTEKATGILTELLLEKIN